MKAPRSLYRHRARACAFARCTQIIYGRVYALVSARFLNALSTADLHSAREAWSLLSPSLFYLHLSLVLPFFPFSLFSSCSPFLFSSSPLFAVVMQFQRYTVASGMSAGGCSEPFPGWSTLQNFTRDVSRTTIRAELRKPAEFARMFAGRKKKRKKKLTRASSAF